MFKKKFIDRLRNKYQTGGELATTYASKGAHLLESIGHLAPKFAAAGRFAGAAGIPLMLGDFYNRGQRLSNGKVNVNQKPFLSDSIKSGPKVWNQNNKSIFKKQEGGMYDQMQQGGIRKYHEGGENDFIDIDSYDSSTMPDHLTNPNHMSSSHHTGNTGGDTDSEYGPNSDNPQGPPMEWGAGWNMGGSPGLGIKTPYGSLGMDNPTNLVEGGMSLLGASGLKTAGVDKLKGLGKTFLESGQGGYFDGIGKGGYGSALSNMFEKGGAYHAGGLYHNINHKKKSGTSRSRSNSTISAKSYSNMESGFKKQEGGTRESYLSVGGKTFNTDAGSAPGYGGRLSIPLMESLRRGSSSTGLRAEMDAYMSKGNQNLKEDLESNTKIGILPSDMSTEPGASNSSFGLRGYHNRNLNRNLNLSLNSNIGMGLGTGDSRGEYVYEDPDSFGGYNIAETQGSILNPYVDASVGLMKDGRHRATGANTSFGVEGSYGTSNSPDPGARLGLKGSYGKFSGNVGYDFTNKSPRIGASLDFQTGGMYDQMKQYQQGGQHTMPDGTIHPGSTHEEYMAMMETNQMRKGGKYPHDMIDPKTGYKIVAKNETSHAKLDGAGFKHNKMMGGGMYSQMKQYQRGGMQLPGGEMEPIPNSDAMQFNGQSHDQGGIMLDPQTEVEGGETMDQVTMAKHGGKRSDYFFSDHLKKGGVSYADMHKDILEEGGSQKKINYLAKMQEKAAGRNPNMIQTAKHGGTKKYQSGGSTDLQGNLDINLNNYTIDPSDLNTVDKGEDFLNNFFETREAARLERIKFQEEQRKKEEDLLTKMNIDIANARPTPSTSTNNTNNANTSNANTRVPTNETILKIDPIQIQQIGSETNLNDNLQLASTPEEQEKIITNEGNEDQKQKLKELQLKVRRGDIPTEAYIAGIAQLIPAAYSFFNKQDSAEQGSYTPGFTSPIIAQRGRASKLDRVNYNNERSENAADMRGLNKFIETSGGGPANIINKMAAYSKKQRINSKINAAETRANTQIANQEAQLEQQMSVNNMARAQQASMTNAQLIRAEAARADQINANNASARQKLKDDEAFNKFQGISSAASGIAGIAGDILSYKAQERLAKTVGSDGIYNRDKLRDALKKENPNMTESEINSFITQFNKTKK